MTVEKSKHFSYKHNRNNLHNELCVYIQGIYIHVVHVFTILNGEKRLSFEVFVLIFITSRFVCDFQFSTKIHIIIVKRQFQSNKFAIKYIVLIWLDFFGFIIVHLHKVNLNTIGVLSFLWF